MFLKPRLFKVANTTVSGEGYLSMSVFKGEGDFISCWKIPFWKVVKLLFTRRIWIFLQYGKQPKEWKELFGGKDYHQPMSVSPDYPFYTALKNKIGEFGKKRGPA